MHQRNVTGKNVVLLLAALGLLQGRSLSTLAGTESAKEEKPSYSSVHRTSMEELLLKFGDKEWEIKGIFPNKNGHLGTFRPGDWLGGENIYFSIGPVGMEGPGYFVQEKPFSRGTPILPVVHILGKGKLIERIPFSKGYC